MDRPKGKCPRCQKSTVDSVFDICFRGEAAAEKLVFAVPGSMCGHCQQLWLGEAWIDLLDLQGWRCVFAIESDLCVQQVAWNEWGGQPPSPLV